MDLLCNAYSTASDEDEDHHHHHSQRPMPEIPTLRPSKRPKTQNPHTTITNPLPFPTIIPQTQNEAPIPGRYISKRERAALAPRVSHPIPPSSVTSPPGFKMNRPPGPGPWSSQRRRGKGGRGPHSPSSSFKTQDKTKSFAKVLKEPTPIALRKTQQDFVIYLKDSDKRFIQNPEMIAQRYFESHIEFPQIGGKTRQYYEAILKETNSVRFMHMSRNPGSRNSEIAFSKAFILGVLSIDDWGLNPNKPQRLHNYQGEEYNYNYWDYIEAWKKVFFYQNSYNTHTWLFRFETLKEPSIVLKELPHWFFQWFILTGPEPNFFPSKLLDAFNLYTIHHPKHQKDENPIKTNILMRFLGQYDIPWIWQWSFNTASHNGLLMLVRDYFYKWWPKFGYAEIMNLIGKDIETFIEFNKQVEIEDKAQIIFKLEKTEFKTQSLASLKEKYPNTPIKELKAKILAALTSKLDMDEDYMSTSSVQETPSQSEPEKDTHFFDIDKDDEDYSLDET